MVNTLGDKMITNFNLGQEVEVRFIGKIVEVKLQGKSDVVYHINGDKTAFAMGIPGDCLFKLPEPEDFKTLKAGEEIREMTPTEIEGKLE